MFLILLQLFFKSLMYKAFVYPIASFLYYYFFSLYKVLYFGFKTRKDQYEILLINNFVKKDQVVLDIGANVGFYSIIFSSIVGDKGKVHCFEPDKINFKYLTKNTSEQKNIVLNNKAVSDKNGTLELYRSDTLNIDHRTYKPKSYKEVISIETVSIDEYVNDQFSVDFIKMDIQGAEHNALKGMQKTLGKNKDVVILSEFWPYGLKLAGSSKEEIIQHWNGLDFHVYHLHEKNYTLIKSTELNTFHENSDSYYNILICRKTAEELSSIINPCRT